MPVWGERIDGEIQEQPVQCADFYSPAPGLANYGLTQIVGLDIESDSSIQITSILGSATQVYANGEAMVLTQPDWTYFERGLNSERSAVHRFAVSSLQQRTPYQGSGFVQGTVNDQFSIDERGGIIRIATTRTTWPDQNPSGVAPEVWVPPTTDNLVSTLRLDGNALELAGSTPPLAEGERIFSARFIGDLAYIVTFRQVDPLFAIDLSNPESPKVLGELKIPGFSDYMHPLDDDHLLTIGRDIDEETQRDNGTALQIFDVSDPVNPMLAHKALVGEGYSEANHNHKAFNFYAEKGLLAFPFVSYEGELLEHTRALGRQRYQTASAAEAPSTTRTCSSMTAAELDIRSTSSTTSAATNRRSPVACSLVATTKSSSTRSATAASESTT